MLPLGWPPVPAWPWACERWRQRQSAQRWWWWQYRRPLRAPWSGCAVGCCAAPAAREESVGEGACKLWQLVGTNGPCIAGFTVHAILHLLQTTKGLSTHLAAAGALRLIKVLDGLEAAALQGEAVGGHAGQCLQTAGQLHLELPLADRSAAPTTHPSIHPTHPARPPAGRSAARAHPSRCRASRSGWGRSCSAAYRSTEAMHHQ